MNIAGSVALVRLEPRPRGPKLDPAVAVRASLDGVERDAIEVVVDDWSAAVKESLAQTPETFYAQFD